MLLVLFLLISRYSVVTTIGGCHSGRNKDHLTLVSCVSQGLTSVPDGIDPGTEVLVLSQNAFVSHSWAAYTTFTHLHELDLSQNLIGSIHHSGKWLKRWAWLFSHPEVNENELTKFTLTLHVNISYISVFPQLLLSVGFSKEEKR